MKSKTSLAFLTVVVLLTGIFLTNSESQAGKPFFTFCFKTHQIAKDNGPTSFALPNQNGSCPGGFNMTVESTPAQLVSDLNTFSKSTFNQGWSLGNFQTSVQDQSHPCLPSQPGCTH
jgi:hypothetical protein